jgi:hypothetical protein
MFANRTIVVPRRSDLWHAKFHTFRGPSTFAMSALRVRRSAVHDVTGHDGAEHSIAWSEIELSVLVLEGKAMICAIMTHLEARPRCIFESARFQYNIRLSIQY